MTGWEAAWLGYVLLGVAALWALGLIGGPPAKRWLVAELRAALQADPGHSRARVEESRVQLLDVVELRTASGRWPAGQVGTVIEDFGDEVIVEISDDHGRGLDFLALTNTRRSRSTM